VDSETWPSFAAAVDAPGSADSTAAAAGGGGGVDNPLDTTNADWLAAVEHSAAAVLGPAEYRAGSAVGSVAVVLQVVLVDNNVNAPGAAVGSAAEKSDSAD